MTDNAAQLAGIGEHQPCPKRGVLVFASLPPDFQDAEDGTQQNDYDLRHWRASVHRDRPATDTERLLLTHLGYTLPTELTTRVQWLSDGVRRRTWPQLEEDTP